jgi:hypothetical protein
MAGGLPRGLPCPRGRHSVSPAAETARSVLALIHQGGMRTAHLAGCRVDLGRSQGADRAGQGPCSCNATAWTTGVFTRLCRQATATSRKLIDVAREVITTC